MEEGTLMVCVWVWEHPQDGESEELTWTTATQWWPVGVASGRFSGTGLCGLVG